MRFRPYFSKELPPSPVDWEFDYYRDLAARPLLPRPIFHPPTDNQPERTVMDNDEIKVGDTVVAVRYSDGPPRTVIGAHEGLLWLKPPFGHTGVGCADDWRKVKAPTPCPERWGNIYPDYAVWYSTRERAEQGDIFARPDRIGVLHLSPNGDCEFIRTEEL